MQRFNTFVGSWKGVATLILAILGIVAYFNAGVENKIDVKITEHEKEFEMQQQRTFGKIQQDVAVLKENSTSQQRQLDQIQQDTRHTQELVEQLIRETR